MCVYVRTYVYIKHQQPQQAHQNQPPPQQQPPPRAPLPPGPPPAAMDTTQAVMSAQANLLRSMAQQVQAGTAPPGMKAATLALMQARAAMMASMGMPVFGLPAQMQGLQGVMAMPSHGAAAAPRPADSVTVASLLKRPGRLSRPERIFVILRGLPGAGKTRVARTLRDIEVCIHTQGASGADTTPQHCGREDSKGGV